MKLANRLTVLAIPLIVLLTILNLATLSLDVFSSQSARNPKQLEFIPFSVTAGVPVGGASIRIKWGFEFLPVQFPVVELPPSMDSFITQSVVRPPDLRLGQEFFVEVIFSASARSGSVNLTLGIGGCKVDTPSTGQFLEGVCPGFEVNRRVEITDGVLQKITFTGLVDPDLAELDLLTIQIGRRAKDNSNDTNPGAVRIEAVRISYTVQ